MEKEELLKLAKDFESLRDERRTKFYDFLKNVITVSIGFLGIMVSLKDPDKMTCAKHLFYSVTILCTGFGILFGLIVLQSEMHVLSLLMKKMKEDISSRLDKKIHESQVVLIDPKIYRIITPCCFLFLFFSLVSTVVFALL